MRKLITLFSLCMFAASPVMAINWSKAPIACLPSRAERWDNPDQMQPCHCPPQSYCPGPNEADKWVNDTMEMPFFLAQRCCTPPTPPNCPPGSNLTGYKEEKVAKPKVVKWKQGHQMLTQTRSDIDELTIFLTKQNAQDTVDVLNTTRSALDGHTNPPSDAFLDGLIDSLDAWNNAYNNLPGRTASQLDRAHYKELKGLDNLYNAARAEKEARAEATEFVTKIVPTCEKPLVFDRGIDMDRVVEDCIKQIHKLDPDGFGSGGLINCKKENLQKHVEGREGCLLEGTIITMADGTRKKVEELALGEEILGNHGKAEIVALSRFTQHTDRMFSINGGKAFFTVEHPVLTPDGWKSIDKSVTSVKSDMKLVGELQVGDVILLEGGKEITVESIKEEVIDGGVNAYNISVGADGSFIANGFIMKGFKKMQMHY